MNQLGSHPLRPETPCRDYGLLTELSDPDDRQERDI